MENAPLRKTGRFHSQNYLYRPVSIPSGPCLRDSEPIETWPFSILTVSDLGAPANPDRREFQCSQLLVKGGWNARRDMRQSQLRRRCGTAALAQSLLAHPDHESQVRDSHMRLVRSNEFKLTLNAEFLIYARNFRSRSSIRENANKSKALGNSRTLSAEIDPVRRTHGLIPGHMLVVGGRTDGCRKVRREPWRAAD